MLFFSLYATLFLNKCAIPLALFLFPKSAAGRLAFAIILTTAVTFLILVFFLFVYWLFYGRRKKEEVQSVLELNLSELERVRDPMQTLVNEFGREVRFDDRARENLATLACFLCGCSLLARHDSTLAQSARRYPELEIAHELRLAVTVGLNRMCELLHDKEVRARDAIMRAREPLHDVHSFHMDRLQIALDNLTAAV